MSRVYQILIGLLVPEYETKQAVWVLLKTRYKGMEGQGVICHETIERERKNVHKYNTAIFMNVSHHHTEKNTR